MSNALKYIENVSIVDQDDIETVTVNEAITACQLQELETLQEFKDYVDLPEYAKQRIKQLEIKLKNIKIK